MGPAAVCRTRSRGRRQLVALRHQLRSLRPIPLQLVTLRHELQSVRPIPRQLVAHRHQLRRPPVQDRPPFGLTARSGSAAVRPDAPDRIDPDPKPPAPAVRPQSEAISRTAPQIVAVSPADPDPTATRDTAPPVAVNSANSAATRGSSPPIGPTARPGPAAVRPDRSRADALDRIDPRPQAACPCPSVPNPTPSAGPLPTSLPSARPTPTQLQLVTLRHELQSIRPIPRQLVAHRHQLRRPPVRDWPLFGPTAPEPTSPSRTAPQIVAFIQPTPTRFQGRPQLVALRHQLQSIRPTPLQLVAHRHQLPRPAHRPVDGHAK